MTSQPNRRWLPRFGLRSLFALVLLVAAYFGSWPWLEEQAQRDADAAAYSRLIQTLQADADDDWDIDIDDSLDCHADSLAPYIIVVGHWGTDSRGAITDWQFSYYLWLFGCTVRLPWTTEQQ